MLVLLLLLWPFVSAGSASLAALLLDRDCERDDRLPCELDEVGLELPPISETILCVSEDGGLYAAPCMLSLSCLGVLMLG